MKSRYSLPSQYRKQAEEQIKAQTSDYLKAVKWEITQRMCYASILALDDLFRNRFGQKDETINRNYQRFASALSNIVADYHRDCYIWEHSDNMEDMSKAMLAELKDRGIDIEFE